MKLIYYSTALYASHGGGNQSILFLKEAKKSKWVDEVLVFPKKGKEGVMSTGAKSTVRAVLRKVGLLQIMFFFRRNRFYLEDLYEMIDQEKPDAILIQTDSSFLQVEYLKKKYPRLHISTVVNSSPFDEPFRNIAFIEYFRKLERKSLALCDCNFFVSRELRDRIMRKDLDDKRDFVIHNGVDIEMFRPINDKESLRRELGFPEGKFIIGYIGTIDSHKRVDVLLKAFKKITTQHPEAFLLIIGNGPDYETVLRLAEELSLNDSVKFTGWINHANVPRYLNCLDLAVHHYANDYMSPLKVFEYMAVGLPVLGPRIPAVLEIFTDRKHLVLTDGSVDDVFSKVAELMENQVLRAKIAEEGRSLITKHYTWEQNADFILTTLKEKVSK
jgi:glycosyltransferase involved in cell wall biosynthesis